MSNSYDARESYFVVQRNSYHRKGGICDNDLDPDEGNRRLCHACSLPIFSTPYVAFHDDDDDDVLVHKCCANLPKELKEHPLHVLGSLILHKTTGLDYLYCFNCQRKFKAGLLYQCPDVECKFTLDVLCAVPVRIVHRSHPHELSLIRNREQTNLFRCGACGSVHDDNVNGEVYSCGTCGFFMHPNCAILPSTIRHNHHDVNHPLSLTYLVPKNSLRFQRCDACSICNRPYSLEWRGGGAYFCIACSDYTIHIRCATSHPSSFLPASSRDAVSGLIHFPMPDECTSFLSRLLPIDTTTDTAATQHKILLHPHDVVLHHNYDDEDEALGNNLCDVCIRPISPPFYTCPQCPNFYLHRSCAYLPSKSQLHPKHSASCNTTLHPLHLTPFKLSDGFELSDIFFQSNRCRACIRVCNGFVYKGGEECNYVFDAECGNLPEAITHEMHGKSHILFLSYPFIQSLHDRYICHCCGQIILIVEAFYECCSCPNFKIHAHCALLPSTVSHKFDRHPLELTSLEVSYPQDADVDFCEICEEGMGKNSWFYHCKECATFFHIGCIPCVGVFSKIKFGEKIGVKCHNCPLTSFRTLMSHTYTCDKCKQTIHGRHEPQQLWNRTKGVAFECKQCRFWLCCNCANEEFIFD